MSPLAKKFNKLPNIVRWIVAVALVGGIYAEGYLVYVQDVHDQKSQQDEQIKTLKQVNKKTQRIINKKNHYVYDYQLIDDHEIMGIIQTVTNDIPGVRLEHIKKQRTQPLEEKKRNSLLSNANNANAVELPAEVAKMNNIPLFKHGLRLELSGNYDALLNYMKQLENQSDAIFWDAAKYEVKKHPNARLILSLHTISDKEDWVDA